MALPEMTSHQALVLLSWTLDEVERGFILTRFKPRTEILAKLAVVPFGMVSGLLVPYWPVFGEWRAKLYLSTTALERLFTQPWQAPGYAEALGRLVASEAPAVLVYRNQSPQIMPATLRPGAHVTALPLPSRG